MVKDVETFEELPRPNLGVGEIWCRCVEIVLDQFPVLRAETLKFKEEGVKEIVSSVLLPWYNSYKF